MKSGLASGKVLLGLNSIIGRAAMLATRVVCEAEKGDRSPERLAERNELWRAIVREVKAIDDAFTRDGRTRRHAPEQN